MHFNDVENIFSRLESKEKEVIFAMILFKGNKSKAAEYLKMNRNKFSVLLDYACEKVKNIYESK